jgi:hypothetical protein
MFLRWQVYSTAGRWTGQYRDVRLTRETIRNIYRSPVKPHNPWFRLHCLLVFERREGVRSLSMGRGSGGGQSETCKSNGQRRSTPLPPPLCRTCGDRVWQGLICEQWQGQFDPSPQPFRSERYGKKDQLREVSCRGVSGIAIVHLPSLLATSMTRYAACKQPPRRIDARSYETAVVEFPVTFVASADMLRQHRQPRVNDAL